MKLLCKLITSCASKEKGIALIMFMLTLPVLLGLTSLVLDTANLLMARQAINKVARVSAASGLNMRALRGWASLVTDEMDVDKARKTGGKDPNTNLSSVARGLVADTMTDAATEQLKKYFPRDAASVATYFEVWDGASWQNLSTANSLFKDTVKKSLKLGSDVPTEQIKITYRYKVKTIFLNSFARVFGFSLPSTKCDTAGGRCWVQSADVASGSMAPATIHLLLDTSGSMAGTKADNLKKAVATFVDYFNPYKDKISVIPFGYGVKSAGRRTPATFSASADGINLDIKNSVFGLTTAGMTNHCDALIAAIDEIPISSSSEPHFVILFTDGAPNTYRLSFCGDTNCNQEPAKLSALSGSGTTIGNSQGWYGWTVQWGKRQVKNPSGTAIDKDPVFGQPLFNDEYGLPVPTPATLDQNLDFREGTTGYGPVVIPPPNPNYWSLQFDSTAPNNYQWSGPSYLVYSDFTTFGDQSNLVDRIKTASLSSSVKTCGPPGRTSSGAGTTYDINEQYNHSRYFASRVVDSSWSLTRTVGTTTTDQRAVVGLNTPYPASTPVNIPYLKDYTRVNAYNTPIADTTPHPLPTPAAGPGCLTSLNAVIPKTSGAAKLYVGNSFLSNTDPATSIPQVGEIVKTAELPYYCAIRAADYLRKEKNAVVFVVGLGTPAESVYTASCNDPMQNALDVNRRKDYFLRRLAFAPESLDAPETFISGGTSGWAPKSDFRYRTLTPSGCTAHPLIPSSTPIPVTIGYSEDPVVAATSSGQGSTPGSNNGLTKERLGAYYGSNDSTQLSALFGKIAKQILSRLSN